MSHNPAIIAAASAPTTVPELLEEIRPSHDYKNNPVIVMLTRLVGHLVTKTETLEKQIMADFTATQAALTTLNTNVAALQTAVAAGGASDQAGADAITAGIATAATNVAAITAALPTQAAPAPTDPTPAPAPAVPTA